MKAEARDRGLVGGLLVLVVLAAVILLGTAFGRPYYRYNTLKSHANDAILMDIGNIEKIRTTVLADAAELGVPLDANNLEVTIVDRKTRVKAQWSEVVDLWGYYQKKLDFVMEVET